MGNDVKRRDGKGNDKDEQKGNIGRFRLRQGNEMRDEKGRVDDEDAEQKIVMLRLQDDKNNRQKSHKQKKFIHPLCTQAISAAVAQEVYDTRESQYDDECEGNEFIQAERHVSATGKRLKLDERQKMVEGRFVVEDKEEIESEKPIRRNQTEQRGTEGAKTEYL